MKTHTEADRKHDLHPERETTSRGMMAAIDTFDWFAKKFYPHPDDATKKFLDQERAYLLAIRNENERLRYIDTLVRQVRDEQKASLA